MASFGKGIAKFQRSTVLTKTIAMVGCLLFLFSFISPFYHFWFDTQFEEFDSVYCWSFKYNVRIFGLDLSHTIDRQHWFSDYWFKFYYSRDSGLGWVLMSMFVAQILTLASGFASVARNRRILALVAIVSSFTTTLLMVEVGRRLYGFDLSFFELGFWLTYPSRFLFIIAFTLSELFRRKQTNP